MGSTRLERVLLVLVVLSLGFNLLVMITIVQARVMVKDQLVVFSRQLSDAEKETINLTLHIKQPVPIQADIPIQKSITVPISLTVAVDQVIRVPVDTPLGTINLNVPLKIDVPVSTTVPVVLSDTVNINTTINLDMDLPIQIPVADSPLTEMLRRLRQYLQDLSGRL